MIKLSRFKKTQVQALETAAGGSVFRHRPWFDRDDYKSLSEVFRGYGLNFICKGTGLFTKASVDYHFEKTSAELTKLLNSTLAEMQGVFMTFIWALSRYSGRKWKSQQ